MGSVRAGAPRRPAPRDPSRRAGGDHCPGGACHGTDPCIAYPAAPVATARIRAPAAARPTHLYREEATSSDRSLLTMASQGLASRGRPPHAARDRPRARIRNQHEIHYLGIALLFTLQLQIWPAGGHIGLGNDAMHHAFPGAGRVATTTRDRGIAGGRVHEADFLHVRVVGFPRDGGEQAGVGDPRIQHAAGVFPRQKIKCDIDGTIIHHPDSRQFRGKLPIDDKGLQRRHFSLWPP